MKIELIIISIFLINILGCSISRTQLTDSNKIAYMTIEETITTSTGKDKHIYDVDENGNVTVVGIDDKVETSKSYKKELIRIKDRKIIRNFINKLEENTKGKANVTFSGTLPRTVFYNKDGEPILGVSFICDDSSIFIYDETKSNDEPILSGINRPFVKAYFQLLKQYAPKEAKRLNKYYKNLGGLEEILKIKKP